MRNITAAAGTCQFRNGPVMLSPMRPSARSLTVVASAMLACSTPNRVGNGLDSGVSDGGVPNPGEALGSNCARAIVLADTRLIATTDEGVVALPKAGGASTTIIPPQADTLIALTLDGTSGYAGTQSQRIYGFSTTGGNAAVVYDPGFDDADGALQITTPSSRRLVVLRHGLELLNLDETVGSKRTSLIDTNPPIGDVAATSTDVFVLQGTDLKRITLGTLANTTLATNLGNPVVYPPSAIAVDDTTVYFIEQHAEVESLRSVPIAGGQPTTLWTKTYGSRCTPSPRALDDIVGHSPSGQLVVDQGSVSWFGAEHFDHPAPNGCGCSTTGCAGEVVVDLRTIAKTGGDATLLATVRSGARQLHLDDSYAYWIEGQVPGRFGGVLAEVPCSIRRTPR